MEHTYDKFPSNMGQTLGLIPRKPFEFNFNRYDVWNSSQIIDSDITIGKISGSLFNNILNVKVKCERISKYTVNQFSL